VRASAKNSMVRVPLRGHGANKGPVCRGNASTFTLGAIFRRALCSASGSALNISSWLLTSVTMLTMEGLTQSGSWINVREETSW
jgi:hypothetical protein